jgi:hypothetical protein
MSMATDRSTADRSIGAATERPQLVRVNCAGLLDPQMADDEKPDPGKTAYLVSLHGPFDSRALVDLPTKVAEELFEGALTQHGPRRVIEAAERAVEKIAETDPDLADSVLAATAIALAFQIEHPGNSATSKSMVARELRETMDRLRELAPPVAARRDSIDELKEKRDGRRAKPTRRSTGAKAQKRS